jgi:hypothetical protein
MKTTAQHFTANKDAVKRNVNTVKTAAQNFRAKEKYGKDDSMTHHDLGLYNLNAKVVSRDKSATLALR